MKLQIINENTQNREGFMVADIGINDEVFERNVVINCRKVGTSKKILVKMEMNVMWEMIKKFQTKYPNAQCWNVTKPQRWKMHKEGTQ